MTDYYGPRTDPARANTILQGVQGQPRAARLPSGHYLVVWEDWSGSPDDPEAAIRGQWYYPGGERLGDEFHVNTATAGNQYDPSVAALANGNLVIAWTGQDANFTGIKAKLYTAGVAGSEFQVNTSYIDTQTEARVVGVANSFGIVWLDKSGSGTAIRAQFYTSSGFALGGERLISTHFAEVHSGLTVAQVGNTGSIVVSWTQTNGDGSDAEVKAQIVGLDGTLIGGPISVSQSTAGNQLDSSVATYAPSRGFIIAYVDNSSTGSSGAIKVRIFDSSGVATGPDLTVTGIGEIGTDPAVIAYASGLFAVSWRDSAGSVRMQVVHPTLGPLGDDVAVTDSGATGQQPALLALDNDSFLAAWADGDIKTRTFDAAPVLLDLLISDTLLSEGLPEHLPVAQLAATAIGASSGITYSILSDSTGGGFAIEGDRLVVADGSRIDFETASQAEVTIRATNAQGSFRDETFSLTIADSAVEPEPWTASPLIPANDAPWGPNAPDIASLESGGFVMVYDDSRFSSPQSVGSPIRGRIFSAAGTPTGPEFEVAIFKDSNAHPVAVGGLAGGGFVVIFTDYRDGAGNTGAQLRGQIFDEDGGALGAQFKVSTTATGGQGIGQIAALPSGGFVITWANGWSGAIPTVSDVKAQIFDSAGNKIGGEIVVPSTNAWPQGEPDVAVLADGGFIVTWTEHRNEAIFAQRFDSAGERVGTSFQISTGVDGYKYSPSVTALAGGGFVIGWEQGVGYGAPTTNPWDVRAQIFNSSGARVGGEFLVHNAETGAQRMGLVTPLKDGGFVATWNEHPSPDGQNSAQGATKAQMFSSTGTKIGNEIAINQSFAEEHLYTAAATLAWGGFVVGYADAGGSTPGATRTVMARMFGPEGFDARDDSRLTDEATPVTGNVLADNGGGADVAPPAGSLMVAEVNGSAAAVDETITLPSGALLTLQADGDFSYDPNHAFDSLAAYGTGGSNQQATDSFTYRLAGGDVATVTVTVRGLYSDPHVILGTPGDDVLTGTAFGDVAEGGDGDDLLTGNGGGDRLEGGLGNDRLDGGDGVDMVNGGPGDDVYWVDSGDIIFEAADAGTDEVRTALASFSLQFRQFENLTATSDSAHQFRGNAAANLLAGGGGNDVLLLQDGGDDTARGGGGSDLLYFGAALSAGDVADGGDGRDALVLQGNITVELSETNLVGIESISLQTGANAFYGDTGDNRYDYDVTTADGNVAAGQQMIVNAQSLLAGEDFTFDGSAESDGKFLVYGGHGVDTLKGGDGLDIFFFEGQRWGPNDKVDGGDGRDSLVISAGSGIAHIEFGEDSLANIESISLNKQFATDPTQKPSYELVLANGNVAPGATLIVNGSSITDPTQFVDVDGSAVHDGILRIFGGAGGDVLIGGGAADTLVGGGGSDSLTGGAGADIFRYDSTSDSVRGAEDEILAFENTVDKIDLSRIDANILVDGNQAFHFIGSNQFFGTGTGGGGAMFAGALRAYESGDIWIVEGDTNGDAVADFVLHVAVVPSPTDTLLALDFIL